MQATGAAPKRTRRLLAVLVAALLAVPGLAACGKKGAPVPPSGDGAGYPRQYPSE